VRLLGVTEEGVVRLELLGSCDGCASSAVTLELAVEDAIHAAAPEIVRIEVAETAKTSAPGVIPVESLTSRLRPPTEDAAAGGVTWTAAARVDDLAVGGLLRTRVGELDVLLCRLISGVYAYRDVCAACGASFDGAGLERSPATPGSAVVTCRSCGAHFDVRRAGADLQDPERHLDPLPLLEHEGVVEVAVRAQVAV
jgi:nitrite reductase/ring-hydroxylating ferredoxin subunit